jgi:hypothetical protein
LSQQLLPYTRAHTATQAAYTRLAGGIPAQVKLEAVRRALHARRAETLAQLRAQIGTQPPGQLSAQIQNAQLDGRTKAALLGELRDQATLAKCARQAARTAARTLAAQMRQGQGIYADECPPETEDVRARGNRILALSKDDKIVAEWGVAPDGAAYLVRRIMPQNPVRGDQVPPGARFVHQGQQAVKGKHSARWCRAPRNHFRLPSDTRVHIQPRVRRAADAGGWTTVLAHSGKTLGRFPAYTRLIPRHALRQA